jgi:hypothetical protein
MPLSPANQAVGDRINSYVAVLIITIFGALMTLLIIRVVYSNTVIVVSAHDSLIYTYLQ